MSKKSSGRGTRPSIREVAELAGAGIASVSRVLSGQPGASPQLTARVLSAAQQLGYAPNILAQSLRKQTTRSIGFVMSDITNPLLSSIVGGAETVLSAAGYAVLLTNSGGVAERDAERIELLLQRQVDGLILLPSSEDHPATLNALHRARIPIVLIDRSLPSDLEAHYVLSDHRKGVGEAAQYLLRQGHRRIGLTVAKGVRPARERIKAVEDGFRAFDLVPQLMIDAGELSASHGEQSVEGFLAAEKPPSAIILGGNQLLEGALCAVRRRGLRLGKDLSLICCDEVALGRLHEPPIATVMRDAVLLGKCAAETLLEQIDNPGSSQPKLLPTWFIPRGSCGQLS